MNNETVSKIKTLIIVCIAIVFMVLDSILMWTTAVSVWNGYEGSYKMCSVVCAYEFLTLVPWIFIHMLFTIDSITTKVASERKWLRIPSILHVIIRALPFVVVWFLYLAGQM